MKETIGLFVHYRPVVLALPEGGCNAVARFLGFNGPEQLHHAMDDAGLLYRHPKLCTAVTSLLHVEPAESTLGGVLHQSLMQFDALTHRPQVFQWNPEAQIVVEPFSLELQFGRGAETLALDLRIRSEMALLPGAHCPPALIRKLKEQGNFWWLYGMAEYIDGQDHDTMEPAEEAIWSAILEEMGLSNLRPIELVRALDEFADCAIDFRYSDAFLQTVAKTLSTPAEYLYDCQVEGVEVIVDVGDGKIQGYC